MAFTFHSMTLLLLMPTPCPALVATKDVQDPLEQMLGSRLLPEGFFKPSRVYQPSCPGAPHGNDSFQPRISLPILQLRSQETAPCATHRELTEHWDVLASKGFCCVTSLSIRLRNIAVAFCGMDVFSLTSAHFMTVLECYYIIDFLIQQRIW